MTIDIENAAPAGDDAGTMPMSMEAAAEFLDKLDAGNGEEEKKPDEAAGEVVQPDENQGETTEEQGETVEADTSAETGETEANYVDFDALKPETKLRLRDGTEFTLADVKKNWDALRNVQKRETEFQTQISEFQQRSTQAAQHEQIFSRLAPMAYQVLQSSLPAEPPRPTRELLESDPINYLSVQATHQEWQRDYGAKLNQMREIQNAEQHRAQQAKQAEEQEFNAALVQNHQQLVEKLPFLRDKAKREEFHGEFISAGKDYGFNEQELLGVYDPRVIQMAADAIAYRKLKAKPLTKPTAQATTQKQPAPVSAPGRRQAPGSAESQTREDIRRQANAAAQKGDLQKAATLLSKLED